MLANRVTRSSSHALHTTAALIAILLCAALRAPADTIPESEPNDTRATAQVITLGHGDQLSGASTGSATSPPGDPATADYFEITPCPNPGGVMRYRLTFTGAPVTPSLRGINPGIPGLDVLTQGAFVQPGGVRYLTWFGVATSNPAVVRVTGSPPSGAYVATLACSPVSTTPFPHPINAGVVTLALPTGLNRLVVFDAAGRTNPDWRGQYIVVTLAPGLHHVAVSANDDPITEASVLPRYEFPGSASTTFTTPPAQRPLTILQAGFPEPQPLMLNFTEPHELAWVRLWVRGPGPGACCIGAGCTADLTPAECSAAGGFFLGGSVGCEMSYCPRACCLPSGNCLFVNVDECAQASGVLQAAGSTCSSINCPNVPGAACSNPFTIQLPADLPHVATLPVCDLGNDYPCLGTLPDAVYRLVVTEPVCARITVTGAGSLFHYGSACPPCSSSGFTSRDRISLLPGETFVVVRSPACDAVLRIEACPPRACCLAQGGCSILAPDECTAIGGEPRGLNSMCETANCPATEPCCLADGVCMMLIPFSCTAAGGRRLPDETCTADLCGPKACCRGPGVCQEAVLVRDCLATVGVPIMDGTPCSASPCEVVCRRGDVNCDGRIDNFDIAPFIVAVLNATNPTPPATWGYSSACWGIRACTGDINRDSTFNGFDIDPFVACMVTVPAGSLECPAP
ncbi:MAG: hypothetical protein IPM64_16690 [Phycisphaerales bacterium]|nr:hypothetical protein [Phycisphaerales bacterium]